MDKPLRKMNREELLQLLIEVQTENEALRKKLAELSGNAASAIDEEKMKRIVLSALQESGVPEMTRAAKDAAEGCLRAMGGAQAPQKVEPEAQTGASAPTKRRRQGTELTPPPPRNDVLKGIQL